MIKKEYLSLVAMEECAELQQALSKSIRFGFDDCHPSRKDESNEQQVLKEYYQLVAMMEELQTQKIVERLSDEEVKKIKADKIKKVYHYMEYSTKKKIK